MRARRAELALIALIVAFGVAASIAAVTTIRQVQHEASSVARPITRG
jgi:hypothetical protein